MTIDLEGDTNDDLDIALDEVVRLLKEGYLSGANKNESGSFAFQVKESD